MQGVNKDVLMELGLTKNEVEVYLKLLLGGSITVNTIAERTGFHRQACYDALDRLLEKGFVNFVIKDNKKHFQALPPEQILVYVEQMRNKIEDMMPNLLKMAQAPDEKSIVEVYKGNKVLRTILRDIIKEIKIGNKEVLITGVDETQFLKYDKPALDSYLRNMRKFKLKEKLISVEGAKTFLPGKQSKYRLIPKKFFNPNPSYIYGDKLVFLIWGTPLYGIMIKNKQIADANRKYFNMLWKIAKTRK